MQTTSSITDWRNCRKLYYYRHVALVRPARKGKALYIGTAMHSGIEAFLPGKPIPDLYEDPFWADDDAQIEKARTSAMLVAYFKRWANARKDWEIVEIEWEFSVKLYRRMLGGKADAIMRYIPTGELYLWEHKTTSEEVSTVGADYWQRLALDTQIAIYQYAVKRLMGEDASILYDVIRKPLGKPILVKRDEAGNVIGRASVARRKNETDEMLAARKDAARETLSEFEARLTRVMLDNPDDYLIRRQVHRLGEQQSEAMAEVRETLHEIERYKGCYPRNDAACRNKFGTCAYLGVCSGVESLDSDKFVVLDSPHPELETQQNQEKDDDDGCPL